MPTHIKNRYTFLILGLAVGMVFGWLVTTDYHLASVWAGPPPQGASQLRGSQAPIDPPGLQELKKRDQQVGQPPRGRPTKQQLEAIINRNARGAERARQAKEGRKGTPLPATAQPVDPPGLQELKQRDQQVGQPPARRVTRGQLLERIPPAAIQKAQQGRLQASKRSFGEWLASLNPFRPATVYAQSTATADFNQALYSNSPYANGYMFGTYVYSGTSSQTYSRTYEWNLNLSDGTQTRMFARFYAHAPSDGWYIVSARASSDGDVKIAQCQSGVGYVVIDTVARLSGWADYPTLQYLTAGYYDFYFVGAAYNGNYFYVDHMSLTPF